MLATVIRVAGLVFGIVFDRYGGKRVEVLSQIGGSDLS